VLDQGVVEDEQIGKAGILFHGRGPGCRVVVVGVVAPAPGS
jgi:hypothetical protein